ncbi:D-glycero-beta-D-manno-heptose 1-phosphate adenylyltransferase [Rugosimonospora africana]|uniref:D-glycero-beta-D-manno-heptose 1-phosphate adenylyltransferase n=1 Tax=Rugosimonospora africana TaxID=556532 RepID=UPI001EF3CB79|nr:D-glycero-beta-D-manno-heptose 1-phosphate adenylyltransferase [Rugosimonospora africana]
MTAERRAVHLTVVGDTLLDRDVLGAAQRVSPEAPVVVVGDLRRELSPGGAGLTAMLAAREGHRVTLVTALARDDEAREVLAALCAAGVAVVDLGAAGRTPVKTRVRAGDQTVVMLDEAEPPAVPGPLPEAGRVALRSAQAVLVSDYGRGVAAADDVRGAVGAVVGRLPVVWDPHPRGPAPVEGLTVVTPNSREAAHFAPGGETDLAGDTARGRWLRQRWGVGYVAVTRGADGAVLVGDDQVPPLVIPPPEAVRGDVRGAGDRLAATTAARLGSGATVSAALAEGVNAATAHVAGREAARVWTHGPAEAMALADRVRRAGGTVVATGGCFDLLHRGHILLLEHARRLGDCLIVCLNSDASVRRRKGEGRPLVTEEDRAAVLRALACVDAVATFEEDTPVEILSRLRPDIWVKGGDYAIGDLAELGVVEGSGGHVVLVPYLDGRSTTSLIERAVRGR